MYITGHRVVSANGEGTKRGGQGGKYKDVLHVPTLCDKRNHYVLQTCTHKANLNLLSLCWIQNLPWTDHMY